VSCNSTQKTANMDEFPTGNYELMALNTENYKPQKTYRININTNEQRLGGKFDCNTFTCEYEKNGKTLDFKYPISTKMYCEGDMTNENAFFGQLGLITTFEYKDETLKFFGEDNNLILELKYLSNE
jgi:heat shock protein HslJ